MLYESMLPAESIWLSYPHCSTGQWGTATLANVASVVVALPITASTGFQSVVSDSGEGAFSLGSGLTGGKTITVWQNTTYNYAGSPGNIVCRWIAICKE